MIKKRGLYRLATDPVNSRAKFKAGSITKKTLKIPLLQDTVKIPYGFK